MYRKPPFGQSSGQSWLDFVEQAQQKFYGNLPAQLRPRSKPQKPRKRWEGKYPTRLDQLPDSVADLPDWTPEDIGNLIPDIRRALFDNLDNIGAAMVIRYDRKARNDKERERQKQPGYQPQAITASVQSQEPESGRARSTVDWKSEENGTERTENPNLAQATCDDLQAGARAHHYEMRVSNKKIGELREELARNVRSLAAIEEQMRSGQ